MAGVGLLEGTRSGVAKRASNDVSPSILPSASPKSSNLTAPQPILLPTEKSDEPIFRGKYWKKKSGPFFLMKERM